MCDFVNMHTDEYRGLINSRNTSLKFDTLPNNNKPSKWFPNVNLCGEDDVWKNYADFHAAVLSGKQKGKYLIYECTPYQECGGIGNRLNGITVLLLFAMLTKRVFLLKMSKPIDVNVYLLPNAIQWNYTPPKGLKRRVVNLHSQRNLDNHYKGFEKALFDGSDYDIIEAQVNYGVYYYLLAMNDHLLNSMISTFNLKTQYDCVLLYGCAYNYLFKYQPRVKQTIESLQTELGLKTGKFVALHVRSHINDGWVFNPFHIQFPFKPMFECAAMAAKSLSHKLNVSKVPIFLATDHPTVTKFAKNNYKDMIVFSKAPRFHVDHTKFRGPKAHSQYDDGMIGVLSDTEICSRAAVLIRSTGSTLSEIMGAIHFLRPQNNLHPYYFYENSSLCHL